MYLQPRYNCNNKTHRPEQNWVLTERHSEKYLEKINNSIFTLMYNLLIYICLKY